MLSAAAWCNSVGGVDNGNAVFEVWQTFSIKVISQVVESVGILRNNFDNRLCTKVACSNCIVIDGIGLVNVIV